MLLPSKPNELVGVRTATRHALMMRGFGKWCDALRVVGYLLDYAKRRVTFTLSDAFNAIASAPSDVIQSFDALGIARVSGKRVVIKKRYPIMQVFRVLQVFRLVSLDNRGTVIRSDRLWIEVVYPERIPPKHGGLTYMEYGAATLWALFLRDGLPQRIVLAAFNTAPGSEEPLIDTRGLDLNIYDRIVMEEFRYAVQRWSSRDNPLGSRWIAETMFLLRPLSDASMLLALASIAGIGRPVSGILAKSIMVEAGGSDLDKHRRSKYYRDFAKHLGIWAKFTEVLHRIRNDEVITNVPEWQRVAIITVKGSG